MPDMPIEQPLADLISKLEVATKGSRELDAQIVAHLYCGKSGHWHPLSSLATDSRCFPSYIDNGPTRSLDAAMMLTPDGLMISMTAWLGQAVVSLRVGSISDKDSREWVGRANILPVALCIAALKARSAI